ncbi:AI-2E family transporter [Thiohalorhabdus sp. Cl-TMA]|uniref:AI-2E family transporter n=1 Tax=Thiohalorhabdus methylotrophus TaxID=3242694 RepID=A0ABV4TXT2_9GAMM
MASGAEQAPLNFSQRAAALISLGALLVGAYWVLRPFIVPILWAAILVYATSPLYRQLAKRFPNRPIINSLVMTLGMILLLFGPVVLISLSLAAESATAMQALKNFSEQNHTPLLEFLVGIPLVGPTVAAKLQTLIHNPEVLQENLLQWAQRSTGMIREWAGEIAKNIVKLGIALLTVFFLYLHGDALVEQTRRAGVRIGFDRLWGYLPAVTQTLNAVLFGLILTALAQGLLAGIAYAVVGLPVPALLGTATALLALIPFGAPIVWVPASVLLVGQGHWVAGIGLLLWGMLVVSWVDNLVRPMVISASTRIPFLLVFFGVIGGGLAFGLIGLFIGPIILSVLMTVWREWTEAPQ